MNEKIEKLAKKAGINVTESYNSKIFNDKLEIFAKLVAKDCANICQLESHAHRMGFGLHCCEMIKSYFDIED
jgi:hypothetical protein